MVQYRQSKSILILDKNDHTVNVTPFRSRIEYPEDLLLPYTLDGGNYNRPDVVTINTLGDFSTIGAIIDSNEKDIFDFSIGEIIYYPDPGAAIV